MIIKVLLVAATLLVASYALRQGGGGRQLALRRLLGGAVAVAAVVAVIWPEAVTWVARLVGVGRGTDLVLYGLVVVFGFVATSLYARVRELDAVLTTLVREHALREPAGVPPDDARA